MKGTFVFTPAAFAAFSIPTEPPKTIKSAKETDFELLLNDFCIFS
jgi:hypothetical protein